MQMLRDVAAWSIAMPAFEDSFMSVAENILGRMLDSFWAAFVVGGGGRIVCIFVGH